MHHVEATDVTGTGVAGTGIAARGDRATDVAVMAADAEPVLICDLDGTILRSNSFPLWIMYLMFGRLPEPGLRARIMLSLRVQRLLVHRRLGRMEHARLMREVQLAWHTASQGLAATADRVPALLRRRVRPAFEPLLQQIATGEIDAVLATAAAGEYALPLGLLLGFRHVLTTPRQLPPDGVLNHGAQKLRRVLDFLADQQWSGRSRVLLTDHIDDLPLMLQCHAVGWFGSAEMLSRARAEAKDVRFIDCRALDAAALPRAILALSEHGRTAATGMPELAESTSA
jgi:phosphoserine phosphatase